MSDVKKEIKFNKSMTSDKRDENFAYLRKNVLPIKTEGLYPSKDFLDIGGNIPDGYEVVDILGSDKWFDGESHQIKAILSNTSSPFDVIFRNLYGGGYQNDPLPSGVRSSASAFGSDGVYVQGRDDNIYRANHTNGNTTVVGALAGNPADGLGGFDGKFYWWANNNGIWQQLPNAGGTQIMTTIGQNLLKMAFLNDQMILAYQSGADIGILFWDKKDTALFDKRVIVKNSTYLAMGVVDGTLILVRSVGNSANAKEYTGEIIVAGYDGENFSTLNSIRAGRRDVVAPIDYSGQNCDVGSEVMVFSVKNNSIAGVNQDLGQNYIYKVRKDGSIEAQYLPPPRGSYDSATVVRVFYDFTLYAMGSSLEGEGEKIYSNQDQSYSFSDYPNYNNTEYITPFLCNAFNYHKLEGFSVTFEKMFKNTVSATTPPNVPFYTITVSNLLSTTLTLNWLKATDNVTAQNLLEYSVYKSSTNNIDTISDITTNGTKIQDWTADVNTFNVTGLTDDTDNYFNVLVRDTGGNISKYSMIMAHTPITSYNTGWLSPTSNAVVERSGTDIGSFTNPTNIYAEDGSYTVSANDVERRHSFAGFGMTVPVGATLVGVQVKVVGYSNVSGYFIVALSKSVGLSGGKTDVATSLGNPSRSITTTPSEIIYGDASTMLWTPLTPAEVNASSFGCILYGSAIGGSPPYTYSIDNVQIKVFYTT